MKFAKVFSAQTIGLNSHLVSIEADISRGLHAFSVVGLPDKAVEESRDRISAAIKNSGYTSPKSKNHKVVISLAPAHIKKTGSLYDLGIALAYLKASGEISFSEEKKLFIGELSLDGKLRAVRGILSLVKTAKENGFTEVFVPFENGKEAALVHDVAIYPAKSLSEVIAHIDEKQEEKSFVERQPETMPESQTIQSPAVSFADIAGQETAKRGLLIAAAGGHNIVLYGPPGTGKTMLARAFQGILPRLSFEKALETTAIHSIAGTLQEDLMLCPPFRSPHHTSSYVSIVGGGTIPNPGEITLAHNGVLFLDEFPEFERRVIDGLREPLEEKNVKISRVSGSQEFPADFILVAAMNPCPCGFFETEKECTCVPHLRERYRKKISGPIIDRVDMWIEVPQIDIGLLSKKKVGEKEDAREKVKEARELQQKRFADYLFDKNSAVPPKEIDELCLVSPSASELLVSASKKLSLSPRAYHRIMRLSRTIADLENSQTVEDDHILEALQYRPKNSGQ